ncbi:helix-turn-helix domain-containing protein [Zobellia roscoffensis]|uniref:helix-turn-helix domain-containing protein n=1 Tax=Zobellia roscoffensis TaxID=2779508 RepID=UPI00188AC947|nr:helix-turn-helix domain-containing protein [Zobellia roscoffensis]
MKEIQFIQTTPDQLVEKILSGVRSELQELKNDFQPKAPTEYLTRKETKDLLRIDLSTLSTHTKNGLLQSYGIGNRVLYKRSEVEKAIQELKHR